MLLSPYRYRFTLFTNPFEHQKNPLSSFLFRMSKGIVALSALIHIHR